LKVKVAETARAMARSGRGDVRLSVHEVASGEVIVREISKF